MSVARLMQQAAAAGSAGAGPEPSGWTDPDLANASYDSVSFSVAGQDGVGISVVFSDDGLSMYIAGNGNDTVYQYTLSTAWDLSTASYTSKSFSVASQETAVSGFLFGADGASFYVCGSGTDTVYQYDLSTAWDVSTASYTSKSLSVSSQDTAPNGMGFKDDGTIMYVAGGVSDTIYQYTLSTAWDISTTSYASKSFSVSSLDGNAKQMYLSPTGDKLWFMGLSTDTVYELDLSTGFDISTAAYNSVSFSITSQDSSPTGVFFKFDGSKMYALGIATDTIYQYSTAAAAPAEWIDPDLANASYDSVSFSVAGQETSPHGIFFKPDGSKVYICGTSSDAINEYDLSTAWDVSSCSFVQSFSVLSQEGFVTDLFFKPDGSKFYIIGSTSDTINEYSLSAAWDVSTASYAQNFSIASQETVAQGLFFSDDGLKIFIVGAGNDTVYQYVLSSAWDISSASYDSKSFSVATQETNPNALFFSPSLDTMFIVGSVSDSVHEYSLSTSGDVSSASYVQSFSVSSQENNPRGISFKDDGSKMYIVGLGSYEIYQYSTAAAAPSEWTDPDLGNASYDSVSFSVAGQDAVPMGVFFKPDGTKLYVTGEGSDSVYEYDASTAWDVSSASYVQSFSVSGQDASPQGLFFHPDGTTMYVVGITNDSIYEYALSTAWDISTASLSNTLDVSTEDTAPRGLFFSADGSRLYVAGDAGNAINQYSLSTAWDTSTASYVQNFSVSSQDANIQDVFLNPDGTKMFVVGLQNDSAYQYSLSTAFDLSTASYDSVSFSVVSQDGTPTALTFKSDGSKMYVLGITNDTIYQYSTT